MAQAASRELPRRERLLGPAPAAQLLTIYGFARLVDDVGDEAAGDRAALLDWLEPSSTASTPARRPSTR